MEQQKRSIIQRGLGAAKELMSALMIAIFTFLGTSALIGTDLFPEPVVTEWSDVEPAAFVAE